MSLISWITLPVNFLSQLLQLPTVLNLLEQIYNQLLSLRPILDAIVAGVLPFIRAWLEFIRPLRDLIGAVLPEWIPNWFEHVVLALTLVAPAILQRAFVKHSRKVALDELRALRLAVCEKAIGIRELRGRPTIETERDTLWKTLGRDLARLLSPAERRKAFAVMDAWLAAIQADKNYSSYPVTDEGRLMEMRFARIGHLLHRLPLVQFTYNAAGALIMLASILTGILLTVMLLETPF